MLPLILAAVLIHPVRSFTVAADSTPGRVSFAHDDQYEYLATPVGLMRSRRLADPAEPAEVVAFDGRRVNDVASNGRFLYVLLGNGIFGTSPDSTLLRSGDHGHTFSPIDTRLAECRGARCEYLVGHHVEIAGGRVVVELGGNVLVTPDEGLHWYQLYGSVTKGVPDLQICPVVFTVGGSTLYLGGECPLDSGWIGGGTLTADGLSWLSPPTRVVPHLDLGNRNVQFIRVGSDMFAGIEGALIRGTSFTIFYDLGAQRYPYIRQFVEWSKNPFIRLAGGFDKVDESGFLAFSGGPGPGALPPDILPFLPIVWEDVSAALPAGTTNVAMLAEAADGTLLIATQNGWRYTVGTIELTSSSSKRRAARH
ncbi:MAG TPA: hypothetical protein VLV78_21645 [Thermoanaerobaculia bacterium]|nr:hypothetical protein [Thermoanaerobaculia bacterium]